MTYKCIFSDIDGTLLNSKIKVSETTKNKIKEINAQGIPFVLVSARMLKGMDFIQKEIGVKAPMICYSGAVVYDESFQKIYSKGFSVQTAQAIHSYIKDNYHFPISIYYDNHWCVDEVDAGIQLESEITGIIPETLDYSKIDTVHKILLISSSQNIDSIEKELKSMFEDLNIYKSKPTYLEIMDRSVLKSEAIRFLCDRLSIDIKDTISFGDNYNDVDMLRTTGVGFAMGNAPKGVLEQVERHTLSNDEDGIVFALEKLI